MLRGSTTLPVCCCCCCSLARRAAAAAYCFDGSAVRSLGPALVVVPCGGIAVIGESIDVGGGAPSVIGMSVTVARGDDGDCVCAPAGVAAVAVRGLLNSAPMVNATIRKNPIVRMPRMLLRVRGSSDATGGGGAGAATVCAGTGRDCHQLQ